MGNDIKALALAHAEPWPSDGQDGYECAGCHKQLWLRSSEYEPRGLCEECVDSLIADVPNMVTDWHDALVGEQILAGIFREQLTAAREALTEACDMLDAHAADEQRTTDLRKKGGVC